MAIITGLGAIFPKSLARPDRPPLCRLVTRTLGALTIAVGGCYGTAGAVCSAIPSPSRCHLSKPSIVTKFVTGSRVERNALIDRDLSA